MDERLGFELDIDVDAHKVPAAVQLLGQMDDRLMRIGKSLERFEVGTRRMGESSNRVRGMVGNFTELASAAQLAGRAFDVVSKAWGVFEKGGDYAVKAMGERSATIRGYTQLLGGDKKQANLEYYRAQQFSQKTDFTSEQIEKSQARLMAQGFRGKDLYATLFSAADLAAIMPGDKNQTLERVTMAMSQIKAKGKLQGEELTQQLAEAGLNTTLVKQQLMKSLGLKSTAEVDKRMGKGEIGADVALPAIQRAILQQLGTSKAGEYATSASGSLTGLISNRDEAVQNLLKGFDGDENLPAMDRYKKALTEQGKLFDINAKTGKQLSLVVQDMANAAVDAKSAWTEFTSGFISSFAESYDKQLRTTGRDFEGAASYASDAMERLGRAIGGLGKVTSDVVGNSNNLFGRLAGKGADVTEDEFARLGLLNQGKYGEFAYQTARGSLPGMAIGGAAGAVSRAVGKYGYGYKYQDAEDVGFAGRKQLKDTYDAMTDFGTGEGPSKGGGGIGSLGIFRPDLLAKKAAQKKAIQEKAESAKSGKGGGNQGLMWGYDFDGGITGQWANQPTLGAMMQGTHTTAAALTTAISARQPDQHIEIIIQGYNRDKMDLVQEIATTLGRINRSPR